MGEVITHICGTCGEPHPSILTIPALLVVFGGYFTYIKSAIKTKIELWKKD